MNQSSIYYRSQKFTVIACLYLMSGSLLAEDNPWLEPRVGPAESRQMSPDINTWSDSTKGIESAAGSKFPPMDEDAALGIETTPVPATPSTVEPPTVAFPSDDITTYVPDADAYRQAPGGYGYSTGNTYPGYAAPAPGYSGQYRRYPDNRYRRGYGPGRSGGGMWPGSFGNGMWPGSSGGDMWPSW